MVRLVVNVLAGLYLLTIPAFSGDVLSRVEVGDTLRLDVDFEGCSVRLSIPRDVHRILLKEFGWYRVYTETEPGFTCSRMRYHAGENFVPWAAVGDFNGDGKRDLFLRILSSGNKVVDLFLVSKDETYELVRPGEPGPTGKLMGVLSPCRFEDRFRYGYLSFRFPFDCLRISPRPDYVMELFIYANGALSRVTIYLGD